MRVYNHKCPAVSLFTTRDLAREIRAVHVINYLNILSDHSDQLATYLVEKVFLLSVDCTEQWEELLMENNENTTKKAT